MRRKLCSLLVVVALIFGLFPTGTLAAPPNLPAAGHATKRYIVKYKSDAAAEAAASGRHGAPDQAAKPSRKFPATHLAQLDLTPADVTALLASGYVDYLEEDRPVKFLSTTDAGSTPTPWSLSSISAPIMQRSGVNGQGIRVAVLDTGITPNLGSLPVKGGISVLGGDWADDHGHGTEVASSIGARAGSTPPVGVAPAVELFAIKVLNATGAGYVSDVLAGMEWAVQNNMNELLSQVHQRRQRRPDHLID